MGSKADFLCFELIDQKPKTKVWSVIAEMSGASLGVIKWHCAWRRYAFYPDLYTLYEHVCLREIADFIDSETTAQQAKRKTQ